MKEDDKVLRLPATSAAALDCFRLVGSYSSEGMVHILIVINYFRSWNTAEKVHSTSLETSFVVEYTGLI